MDYVAHYLEHGYAILRAVFPPGEVDDLAKEFDRVKTLSRGRLSDPRPGKDIFFAFVTDPYKGPILRFIHWPNRISPVFERFRTDQRFLEIVQPLIGKDIKQAVNAAVWKEPGADRTSYEFHQDSRFRRPVEAFRNLASSYVEIAVAIDPHTEESGCIKVYPGSHRKGQLNLRSETSVYQANMDYSTLEQAGLHPSQLVNLELEPGDLAMWAANTIHGSGPNHASHERRAYLHGLIKAEDCDLPYWAFRAGEPVRDTCAISLDGCEESVG